MAAGIEAQTIRRIEQATGRLATQSVARMDAQLPWFRDLPPEQRSWVTLVAQSGLQAYVQWLQSPEDVMTLIDEVFASAPRAMARSVTLQQTVELVRQTIAVAEENLPKLAAPGEVDVVLEQLLRFSREIAFAAAHVYASAAESRGSWDDRLQALVIDRLVSGREVGEDLPSQFAALGWRSSGPIGAVVGTAAAQPPHDVVALVQSIARRHGADSLAAVHGTRLVVVHGGAPDGAQLAAALLPAFGAGPVVTGPPSSSPAEASDVTRAALSGLRAAPAWLGAPRPVGADDLLPERALLGDAEARALLLATVYEPLIAAGPVLLDTLSAFLDSGGALESTARSLFVHANTVRYRLRQVADVCGQAPTDARGAFVLRFALALGRLQDRPSLG